MRKDDIRWVRLDLAYENNEDDSQGSKDNEDSLKVEVSGVFNGAIELGKIHSICYARSGCS